MDMQLAEDTRYWFAVLTIVAIVATALFEFLLALDTGRIKLPSKGATMRVFNAFQIVLVLVLSPFGIQWLADASFKGATVAFWASLLLYIVACIFNVGAVARALKDVDKNW